MSPTEQALRLLKSLGYRTWVVEKFIPQAQKRLDMWNIVDIEAFKAGIAGVLYVQVTSGTNHTARLRKAHRNKYLPEILSCPAGARRFQVWSWGRISRRITDFSIRNGKIEELELDLPDEALAKGRP